MSDALDLMELLKGKVEQCASELSYQDAQSAEELLKNADTAMYKAKRSNKGHLLFSQLTQAHWRPQIVVGSVRSDY